MKILNSLSLFQQQQMFHKCQKLNKIPEILAYLQEILLAAQLGPAVSITQASLLSAIKNELWYERDGSESEQRPPWPCETRNSAITLTAFSAVADRSSASLNQYKTNFYYNTEHQQKHKSKCFPPQFW